MSGRPNKPLFELLRDTERETPARPLPPLKVDAPMPRSERIEREDVSAARSGGGRAQQRAFLPVSPNAIYIGIAAGLVLVVVAYAVGVTVGKNSAGAEYRQRLAAQNPALTVSDPLADSGRVAPRRDSGGSPTPGTGGAPELRATPLPAVSPDGRYLSSRGNLAGDPRESGLNYLSLAIMDQEATQSAIGFLSGNGVEAVGVPILRSVDPKRPGANNLPTYKLVALPGISGAEYSQRQPVRMQLEDAVERLGAAWQKEYRGAGSSNFAKHAWEKYTP